VQVAEPAHAEVFSSLNGLNRLALAVSGGSDSMALLRMVHEWASPEFEIFGLTVNHGLRDDAAQEAAQVSAWCALLGIDHIMLRWEHDGIATGVQAKARKARYDVMASWCLAHDVSTLLTAHTADDQAETVAMRLLRTSTAASLSGIWPERRWNGIRVLRPLLNLRREHLRAYLGELGQPWIDDPSNENTRFERVRIRRSLNGQLSGLEKQATEAQFKVIKNREAAAAWCAQHFLIHETGFMTVDRREFSSLTDDVLDSVLLNMIDVCAPCAEPPEREERVRLSSWLRGPQLSRRTLGGVIFAKRSTVLIAGREPSRISVLPVVVPDCGVVEWDNRFAVRAPEGCDIVAVGTLDQMPRRKDIPAFVQSGLPAVRNNGGIIAVPHLGIGEGVVVKILRH
jgi:tRNA(Ile)-lysidine synthase